MTRNLIAIVPGGSVATYVATVSCVSVRGVPETPKEFCDLIAIMASAGSVKCYLEQPAIAPGTNRRMFPKITSAFWRGFGNIEGILIALQIPFVIVPTQRWQKALGLVLGYSHPDISRCGGDAYKIKWARQRASQRNAYLKKVWQHNLKEVAQRAHPSVQVTPDNSSAILLLEYARRQEP
jgi:hypothetical protein